MWAVRRFVSTKWVLSLAWVSLVHAGPVLAQQHVVEKDPLTPAEQLTKFHLPEGFEIQLVASEPEIAKPINLNFDSAGRLLITQSVEYPYAAKDRGRDAVVRLTINPATGRASKVETVVDGLNIPIGVTPLGKEIIVYTIAEILRCSDPDGDGLFDKRETLFRGFGFDDTHGMNNGFTRGLDGWIYACHGFRNQSDVVGKDGQVALKMQSGNTYRFLPDGSQIQQFTWGQVNPFGMCFDPLGNLYTADCHSRPAYMVLRGAYYPSFGKPHDGLGYGPEMMTHSHGSTGIAGVVYYDADQFPAEYRGRLFIGNPITQRINADRLEPHGSTYKAIEAPDFLACDDPWCRPVDIKLGPDGALYFADFYNRIIGHYEVPLNHPGRDRNRGRIWRIVYKGKPGEEQKPALIPNLAEADFGKLLAMLGSPNLTVRTLATNELVDRGRVQEGNELEAKPPALLTMSENPQAIVHAMWVLERLNNLDEVACQLLAGSPQQAVRVHLQKILANRKKAAEVDLKLSRAALADSDAFVRRAAAEALGQHPAADNVQPLLQCWNEAAPDDDLLIHTLRMAVRNQFLVPEVLAQAASLKLEQPAAARLLEVLLGTRSPAAADFVLQSYKLAEVADPRAVVHFLVRNISENNLPAVFAKLQSEFSAKPDSKTADILTTVQAALGERGQKLPATERKWCVQLADQLLNDAATRLRGVEFARDLALMEVYARVEGLAVPQPGEPTELRPLALDACAAMDGEKATGLLAKLLGSAQEEIALRQKCAATLGRLNSAAAQDALVETLRVAPDALAITIAVALGAQPASAEKLLAAVAAGKASPRLLQDQNLVRVLRNSKTPEIDARIKMLTENLPPQDDRLTQIVNARRVTFAGQTPDVAKGQQLFTKTCSACHRLGNVGNKIGPELDGIGNRGLNRVLEDVLDPSRNVDGAFRTTVLATRDGRTVSGLLLRQEGATLILADNQGKEVRVAESDVEERTLSPLSPMPANVAELLKEPEFYDLLGYLLEQKQKPDRKPE